MMPTENTTTRSLGTVAVGLAMMIDAYHRCKATGNPYADTWEGYILDIVNNHMPSGSGWDNGTSINLDESSGDRLRLYGSFHHMDEHGFYNGWTEHTIDVTASLAFGFNLRVTGRNRNGIKDYLGDMFCHILGSELLEHRTEETVGKHVTFTIRETR